MSESKEELKDLLTRVKEEREKAGLKLNIQKTKTMVTSPITSCQNTRGKSGNSNRFFFPSLGSKITADVDCKHEIKRSLLLGRKAMTNLDSVLKSKDITLRAKGYLLKTMVFPIVMYRCESWTIKKAEYQRIETFEMEC